MIAVVFILALLVTKLLVDVHFLNLYVKDTHEFMLKQYEYDTDHLKKFH